jgi:hypothetical protein
VHAHATGWVSAPPPLLRRFTSGDTWVYALDPANCASEGGAGPACAHRRRHCRRAVVAKHGAVQGSGASCGSSS